MSTDVSSESVYVSPRSSVSDISCMTDTLSRDSSTDVSFEGVWVSPSPSVSDISCMTDTLSRDSPTDASSEGFVFCSHTQNSYVASH